ncbi:MAG: DUF2130 domain-containing protein [Arenicellales bacterium]
MTDNTNRIECPNCGFGIDVNSILSQQVESRLKKQFGEQRAKEEKHFQSQVDELKKQQLALEQTKQRQHDEIEHAIVEGLREREASLVEKLNSKIRSEQSETLDALNKELGEKTEQLKDLHRTRTEMEKLKREKDQLRDEIQSESEQRLNKVLAEEREKFSKSLEQKSRMDLAERDKVISDLSQQLRDAQRKAEQGSMQLQGEVQELAIEEWLKNQFPLDTIEEIKKGARGADCLQIVHTRSRQNCGTIYYESKRSKSFQPSWIEKFKQDIREKGADIGVLVTQVMPTDMERLGLKEGVWICTFEEFRGLSLALRDAAIRMSDAVNAQENKGDKMGMLYDFLTGNEFRNQVEAIVEGFTQMQADLESEKRSMQSIWKKREKQIEKVLLNTNHMYGSIKGIAGNAIQSVPLLDLESEVEE